MNNVMMAIAYPVMVVMMSVLQKNVAMVALTIMRLVMMATLSMVMAVVTNVLEIHAVMRFYKMS